MMGNKMILCDNCGENIDDKLYACADCGNTVCDVCATVCKHCKEYFCDACYIDHKNTCN